MFHEYRKCAQTRPRRSTVNARKIMIIFIYLLIYRVARSIGEWRQKENKAAVTKITGSTLTGYGFQNKNGKFLNSEEATFFLETVTHLFLG
jgi:hypothetical protein